MSDDLIDRLVTDLEPTRPQALPMRLFGWAGLGIIASAILMLAWLGLRPDLMPATGTMMFWTKFAYTLVLAVLAAIAALNLARPGGGMAQQVIGILALVALTGAGGVAQLFMMGPEQTRTLIMGGSALLCPFYIVALSAPIFLAIVYAMRRAAPTNPTRAGFAAGLMAGAAATWVYAFHCTESGMPFITIWYSVGILAAAGIGAALGRFVLRWR